MKKGKCKGFLTMLLSFTMLFIMPSDLVTQGQEIGYYILDNSDTAYYSEVGVWHQSALLGYNNTSTRYSFDGTAKWAKYAPKTGNYNIYVWYPAHDTNSMKCKYTIESLDGTWVKEVNQKEHGNQWYKIATVTATKNAALSVSCKALEGYARADAIKIEETTDPADEKYIEDDLENKDGTILLNQSGFDLYRPKRFTIFGIDNETPFYVKRGDEVVYEGQMMDDIGDFSDYNPTDDYMGEYYVECEGKTSHPFSIGAYWMQKISIDPALQFMIWSRDDVFLRGEANYGIGWRDSHQFSFELNTLVMQYMANPSAYDRMDYTVNASDCDFHQLHHQQEPDLVWLIKYGATRYWDTKVNKGLDLHELVKGQMTYFLYLYPQIEQWVDEELYRRIRDLTISEWSNPNSDLDFYDVGGHDSNLFATKEVYGTGKGSYPPGHSIIPNLLMYEVLQRDGLVGADAYFEAAYNNCQWVINHVDFYNPETTKGQRMSEHITMEALTYFYKMYPNQAPQGLLEKIEEWADIMISRSNNLWDFRKYDDPNDGVGDGDLWIIPTYNEPGNVAGFMAPAYAVREVLTNQSKKDRLEEIAIAQMDNVFGRNPFNRHYCHDGVTYFQGVELGWFSEFQGGAGLLNDVPAVLDGSPKEASYPYNPNANEGYTEGWVAFNSAWNASLAYSAADDTTLQVYSPGMNQEITSTQVGDTIEIKLRAPLNFQYDVVEEGAVKLEDHSGREIDIQVIEGSENDLYFIGQFSVKRDVGDWIKLSYGYGMFKEEVILPVTAGEGEIVYKKALRSKVEDVESIEAWGYTSDSYSLLQTRLEEAVEVLDNHDVTQTQVDDALQNLIAGENGLVIAEQQSIIVTPVEGVSVDITPDEAFAGQDVRIDLSLEDESKHIRNILVSSEGGDIAVENKGDYHSFPMVNETVTVNVILEDILVQPESIVDNLDNDCTYDSPWVSSTWDDGYYGSNYMHDGHAGADEDRWFSWPAKVPKNGEYQVYMKWVGGNRADAAPVAIQYEDGLDDTVTVNQNENGGEWVYIGKYHFAVDSNQYVKILGTDSGYTIADAVRFLEVLENMPVSKLDLGDVIEEAKLIDPDEYTEESYSQLQDRLSYGEWIYDSVVATLDEIEQAYTDLLEVIDLLKK